MVVKNITYHNPHEYLYLDQKRKLGLVKRIQKQIDKFAFTNQDLNFVTSWYLVRKFTLVRILGRQQNEAISK